MFGEKNVAEQQSDVITKVARAIKDREKASARTEI